MKNFEFNNNNTQEVTERKQSNGFKKVAAFALAIIITAGSSIGAYRYIEKNNISNSITAEVTATTESTQSSDSSDSTASLTSLSNTSTSTGSDLTTEEIANKLLPSVVGIESTFEYQNSNSQSGMFSYGNTQSESSDLTATGTGIVYSADGYIVTNAHVIYDEEYTDSAAKTVKVITNDQTEYDATIVAYDTEADIAVLKVDATNLTPAEFGSSSDLEVGESVVAIGNPLGLDLFNTVTSGIVSGLNREITINDTEMTLIQTDAAINSGNSGGPLINSKGQVIGINSSKMSSNYSETTIEGIGFAIPSDYAQQVISDLINYGYVTGRAQIGISCQDITEDISNNYNIPIGVYVIDVTEGSCAEKAGVQQGDVITAVNGEEITSYSELKNIKNKYSSGDTMTLTIYRNNEELNLTLTLDEQEATTEATTEASEGVQG